MSPYCSLSRPSGNEFGYFYSVLSNIKQEFITAAQYHSGAGLGCNVRGGGKR